MSTPEPSTLIDLLADTVAADPASTVAIDAGAYPRRVSRGELWRRTVTLRDELRERGVGEGDCVGVWLPNWSDTVVWQFAAAALGAHVIGINTRYGVGDVAHVLERARPRVVALARGFLDLDLAETLRAAVAEAGVPAPSVAIVPGPDGHRPLDPGADDAGAGAWVPTPHDPAAPLDTDRLRGAPDAWAVAFTTSGSTGKPKLAAHLGSAVAAHARNVAAAGGWDATSVSLVVLPLSGVFGYVPALAAIASGGAVLLEPTFDPGRTLGHMAEFGATHLACADDIVGRLRTGWEREPTDLARWSRMLMADFYGDSLALAEWAENTTGTPAMGVYGSSEVFALTAFWRMDDDVPARWRGGGRPVSPAVAVRAIDPVTDEPPAAGQPGELQFRGYPVVDGYLGDHDGAIRARSFTADGWFRSGDLGVVHADGSFDYVCRMGDAIRLKGFLVEPAEIELRIAEHPGVVRAKVVGVPVAGETRTVAFVEPDPDATVAPVTADELVRWCAATLAPFKVPQHVRVIDEMPMTVGTNGSKIRTAALRARAEELLAGTDEG